MSLAFDFDPGTGFLPPGRYSCSLQSAKDMLVSDTRFANSNTRGELWNNLELFLAEFVQLEANYLQLLPHPLVHRVWLAGSFVSSKIDPQNVDMTLLLDERATNVVKGNPGAGILKKSRAHWLKKYDVSVISVPYQPVASAFREKEFTQEDQRYYQDRGRWDDWWQRTRDGHIGPPTVDTALPRRGYLEVSIDD